MSTGKQFTLAQMQNWMQATLVRQDIETQAARPEFLVNSSSRLSAARHLNIYRQSYIARLRECMKNQFSALAYALGEELFQMFADQYLDAFPSESYTLNELGKKFPAFLEETRPDKDSEEKESWIDFIIELASFEYTLSEIFEAHEEETKTAIDSTPDDELKLAPLAQIFYHRYPVCRYYLDVTRKREPELPFEEDSYSAVTRANYRLSLLEIKPAQYHFLERLAAGDSVSQAKEFFVKKYGFDAAKLDDAWTLWRKNFISSGFFHQK
jgi:Putative DNA-binding domain